MSPRVGIVGARRVRQGLGPFVARDLVAAGAEVPAILATTADSRDDALRGLREIAGVEARGFTELVPMLASTRLDALAILSPSETHGRYLDAALAAGLHVLTEKPFLWGTPDLVARTRALTTGFGERGLQLWENCQWPWTLPAFDTLHPGVRERAPRRFEMWMQPSSRGLRSLGDSIPHPLSLLQAVVPGADPRVEDVAFSTRDPASPALSVRFRYRTGTHACDATVHLEETEVLPRRAAFALDGHRALRVVSPQDYRLSFADAGRTVPMRDPLTALVADFVSALAEPPEAAGRREREIAARMQMLCAIVEAYAPEEAR